VLEAQNLECERGGRRLFSGLSFSLGPGDALRISGANGSGKSSLLRILCGLLPPSAGEVRWQASPIKALQEDYSRQLVYLGHAAALKDDLSAAENLRIACRIAGAAVPQTSIGRALARFGLDGGPAAVKRLSQGQRRRAALARLALSQAVPLWLLDEPLSALDPQGAELLKAMLLEHLARGGVLAYYTLQDAGIPAARVVVIDA